MDHSTLQLFVYGSLRSGFHNPAYAYLTKHFNALGDAVTKGRFFLNGEIPVAVPATDDHFLTGELYELKNPSEFSWVFEQIDDYEGMNVMPGETALYRREKVTVFREGSPSTAWIYWFNGPVAGMEEIETGDLIQYLQQKNRPRS
jgi:gamma-glutamylcyclotransferase (GGCT)/AIG2-like uncharacterized protein YtfP